MWLRLLFIVLIVLVPISSQAEDSSQDLDARIKQLEKENADLKKLARIETLERENAELKKRVRYPNSISAPSAVDQVRRSEQAGTVAVREAPVTVMGTIPKKASPFEGRGHYERQEIWIGSRWEGFYVGANAGAGFGNWTLEDRLDSVAQGFACPACIPRFLTTPNMVSPLQIGH